MPPEVLYNYNVKKVYRYHSIVRISHLNYNGTPKKEEYAFKTIDRLTVGDIVECDTCYGIVLGQVVKVYLDINDLVESDQYINFSALKYCRLKRNIK